MGLSDWKEMIYILPVVLFGLTIHEFFHAITAYKMGDNTPLEQGRLTLNPIPHIDLFGLIAFIVLKIGWAKPVVFDPSNFKRPKLGEVVVALAGPAANLFLAFLFALIMKLAQVFAPELLGSNELILNFLSVGIWFNCLMTVFNLLPIPPLDGSHLLMVLIPDRFYRFKQKVLQIGSIGIILVVIANNHFKIDLLPIFPMADYLVNGLVRMLAIQ